MSRYVLTGLFLAAAAASVLCLLADVGPWAALSLAGVTAGLGVAAWRSGGVALTGASAAPVRALVLLVALGALSAAAARGWDRGDPRGDGVAAVRSSVVLYPAFVKSMEELPAPPRGSLVNVVRAQKVLLVMAIAALIFSLTETLNAWLVGGLAWAGAFGDLLSSASVHRAIGEVGPGAFTLPLVFFYLAATFAYLARPGFWRGAVLAQVVSVLVLARAANAGLAAVFLLVWVFHLARGDGALKATFWAVLLGALAVGGVLPFAQRERLCAPCRVEDVSTVAANLASGFRGALAGPLAFCAPFALCLYLRTRTSELLFALFFAAVPLVARAFEPSLLGFAEALAAPLLAAVTCTLGSRALEPGEPG